MKRQYFLEKLTAENWMFGFKNLIYMDESGFDAHCHRDMGSVRKGQRILGLITGKRKRRTHLIIAQRYNTRGLKKKWLAPMLFEGSYASQLVQTWMENA